MRKLSNVLAGSLVILVATLPLGCRDPAMELTVTFQDAQGLRASDPVTYRGVTVGTVRTVRLTDDGEVRVLIDVEPRHASRLTTTSRFRIQPDESRASQGGKTLAVLPGREPGKPLLPGAQVKGESPARWPGLQGWGEALRDLIDGAEEGLADFVEGLQGQVEQFEDLLEQDELERLHRRIEKSIRQARKEGRSTVKRLREEVAPQIRREIEELAEELRRQGRSEEAQKIRERLRKMVEDGFWMDPRPTSVPTPIAT